MPKKKDGKIINAEEYENLEDVVDLDLVKTSVKLPREDLRLLKIEAATEGKSMAGILRGLLRNFLSDDAEEIRELIDDNLDKILKSCKGLVRGFEIDNEDGFVEKLSYVGISLSDLNNDEWDTVLGKLEIGFEGYGGTVSASDFVDKFSDLSPSKSQKRELRRLARRVLSKQKNSW